MQGLPRGCSKVSSYWFYFVPRCVWGAAIGWSWPYTVTAIPTTRTLTAVAVNFKLSAPIPAKHTSCFAYGIWTTTCWTVLARSERGVRAILPLVQPPFRLLQDQVKQSSRMYPTQLCSTAIVGPWVCLYYVLTTCSNCRYAVPLACTITHVSQGSFQLMVRVRDQDSPDADDLIDRVVINSNLAAGSSISARNYLGIYSKVTMRMAVTILCNTNFYGSDCTRVCIPRDDSSGHFTCDSNGDIVCRPGWTNVASMCTTRM